MAENDNKINNSLDAYMGFPKAYTCTASRWIQLKAKLFGKKFDEPRITAYLYKGKFYITRLR